MSMINSDKLYYIDIRNTDMSYVCSDFYCVCYLVYGLSHINWLDLDDILISSLNNNREKEYYDPLFAYQCFIEDLAN